MKRSPVSIDKIKNIFSKYEREKIIISRYYLDKLYEGKRDISAKIIKDYIVEKDPYFIEQQIHGEEVRYKAVFELSKRYDLVLVIAEQPKVLKVITAYKTSKRLKKKWKKKSQLVMKR